jgi:hypothetical protein
MTDALSACDRAGRIDVPITRWDLACLFAARGYTQGAEIGVERGEFSEALMQANERLSLIAVDAWQAYRGYREHVTQEKLDGFYRETLLRLRPYGVSVRRGFSTMSRARCRTARLVSCTSTRITSSSTSSRTSPRGRRRSGAAASSRVTTSAAPASARSRKRSKRGSPRTASTAGSC